MNEAIRRGSFLDANRTSSAHGVCHSEHRLEFVKHPDHDPTVDDALMVLETRIRCDQSIAL